MKLSEAYVIIITPFDPFSKERMKYTFRMMCEEDPSIPYDDGAVTVYLNTGGKRDKEKKELEELLAYMEDTRIEKEVNPTLRKIQEMVDAVKQDKEAQRAAMKFQEILREEREEGREEGQGEGIMKTFKIIPLVRNGTLSIKEAAAELGMTEAVLSEQLKAL